MVKKRYRGRQSQKKKVLGPEDPSIPITSKTQTRRRKSKYALSLEECLKKPLNNLQMWREMFDPSWYLIIRVSRDTIDQRLEDHSQGTGRSDTVEIFRAVRDAVNPGLINWVTIRLFSFPQIIMEKEKKTSSLRQFRL